MRRLDIQNEIKSIIIIWNLTAKPTKIEVILYVIIIDFTEELIPS
jgi:hypothetical protein